MTKVRPLRPGDVAWEKKRTFPDAVIASFNELIAEKWSGSSATIELDDVVVRMLKKGLKRREITAKHWLDVEDVYRSVGWYVEYDSPGDDESFPPARFTFSRKR